MAPELETIVMTCTEDPKDPIAPVVPLTVAVSAEKETVPKLARGRTPPLEDGASAIHSAEDRWAECTLADVLKETPVVVSVIVTVNLPLKLASAVMWSPGVIVNPLTRNKGCGKNSNHA
jgi:hypothetical protein